MLMGKKGFNKPLPHTMAANFEPSVEFLNVYYYTPSKAHILFINFLFNICFYLLEKLKKALQTPREFILRRGFTFKFQNYKV